MWNAAGMGPPTAPMTGQGGVWWVFDPVDSFAHVLVDPGTESGPLVTICGRELPVERTSAFSVPPSLAICPVCRPPEGTLRPSVVFPTPTHY